MIESAIIGLWFEVECDGQGAPPVRKYPNCGTAVDAAREWARKAPGNHSRVRLTETNIIATFSEARR